MSDKKTKHEIVTVEFRGQKFDVDRTAFTSLKVQTAISLGTADPARHGADANKAMDLVCCGDLLDYIGRVPDADGNAPDESGCSAEDWQAFTSAVAEELTAKNS